MSRRPGHRHVGDLRLIHSGSARWRCPGGPDTATSPIRRVAGPVRARPPVGQLAVQVTAGALLVLLAVPRKPKLVLAPAPSRPL